MIFALIRRFRRRMAASPPAPVRVAVLLVAVVSYGTSGFLYFELPGRPELTWSDGFWWSLVTMTTIGYGDLFPMTVGGRFLVAVPLMMFGIGLLGYVLSLAASALVEAKARELRGMNDFDLKDHLIIVNLPSVEKLMRIVDELRADPSLADIEIILIDEVLSELPPELAKRRVHFVRGNPARDETLRRASLDKAKKALVLARPGDPRSDDLALAVTLAIEGRESRVRTVTECVDVSTEELLRKAGCDNVVCISRFEAHFLSSEIVNPGAQDVVADLLSNLDGQQLYFTPASRLEGKTFSALRKACDGRGHLAIGIRRKGKPHLNVGADFSVESADDVISVGQRPLA